MEKGGLAEALLEAGASASTRVSFADEMRLGLLGQVRRRWVEVGYKLVQPVQVVYQWRYLLLAVDGVAGKLYWTWLANMKGTSIAAGLTELQAQGVAAVVWDGAGGHRALVTQAVEVIKVRQPPYAPELNPAERVFEEVRRAVEGRVYDNVADKQAAVDEWLSKMNGDAAAVQRLAGWEWIRANHPPVQEYAALPAGNGIIATQPNKNTFLSKSVVSPEYSDTIKNRQQKLTKEIAMIMLLLNIASNNQHTPLRACLETRNNIGNLVQSGHEQTNSL